MEKGNAAPSGSAGNADCKRMQQRGDRRCDGGTWHRPNTWWGNVRVIRSLRSRNIGWETAVDLWRDAAGDYEYENGWSPIVVNLSFKIISLRCSIFEKTLAVSSVVSSGSVYVVSVLPIG